jgi:hypothetical protein
MVGSAAASWDDYAGAVATIGQAQSRDDTRGWLGELITDRIIGLDAGAVARYLAGGGDHIKTTVEITGTSTDTTA